MKTYQTYCPMFPGFYSTIFEYDRESDDIENYNEENGTDLNYEDFNWDYSDYHKRTALSFISGLEGELNQFLQISIEFEEIRSPREYNFSNDSINVKVKVSLSELIGLIKEKKDKATQYFKDHYTSYDGFYSFHSNDVNDWLNPKYIMEMPEHRIGGLLDCICDIEIEKDNMYYWCDDEQYIDFWPKEETVKVIISHIGDNYYLTEENAFAPMETFESREEAESYANEHKYKIVACVD